MKPRLTETQRRVVEHEDGALLVVAGPGSGKTRVLTERVRRLFATSDQSFRVLALTFTNKAANEMVQRLEDVPDMRQKAFVGTLHSFCMEVLANRGKTVGITSLPHIFESFDDRKQILANAVKKDPLLSRLLRESGDSKQQQTALGRWLGFISEAKNALRVPSMLEDDEQRQVYEAYDAELRACDAVDYDDLLLLTYRVFEERPKIADFYRRQYRYICVDEAQDLNRAQYHLLCSLCGKDYYNVMMVGDPKQAIYVFNGASPKYMDFFARDFKATVITLTDNFRCSRTVLAAAQALDVSYSIEGQLPIEGVVVVQRCENEEAEAQFVIEKLRELTHNGHPDVEGTLSLERCAVLGRNRFVFNRLESALKDAGVKYYKKLSGAPYRSESGLIEEFELALRVVANPLDRLHLGILAARWKVSARAETLVEDGSLRNTTGIEVLQLLAAGAVPGSFATVQDALRLSGAGTEDFDLSPALTHLEGFAVRLPDNERALVVADCEEWRRHWDTYVRSEPGGSHSISTFLSQVALGTTQQPSQEGIALLTVHSAKGMEFDVVFLIGMAEGIFPDYRAKGPSLEEEQRSAFVAITRSKRLLYLTYPRVKVMPWGDTKAQQPSRYLQQIVQAA